MSNMTSPNDNPPFAFLPSPSQSYPIPLPSPRFVLNTPPSTPPVRWPFDVTPGTSYMHLPTAESTKRASPPAPRFLRTSLLPAISPEDYFASKPSRNELARLDAYVALASYSFPPTSTSSSTFAFGLPSPPEPRSALPLPAVPVSLSEFTHIPPVKHQAAVPESRCIRRTKPKRLHPQPYVKYSPKQNRVEVASKQLSVLPNHTKSSITLPIPSLLVTGGTSYGVKILEKHLVFRTQSKIIPATLASQYSSEFPSEYHLLQTFSQRYSLHEQLGSGGFGFVMVGRERISGMEVAVKFMLREKVPPHCWVIDPVLGRVPTEVAILRTLDHPGIIKLLRLYQDSTFIYLVQELHGSPWKSIKHTGQHSVGNSSNIPPPDTLSSVPSQPPLLLDEHFLFPNVDESFRQAGASPMLTSSVGYGQDVPEDVLSAGSHEDSLALDFLPGSRPNMVRRRSHDLFECIEQHERFPEHISKYIFTQVVDVVEYMSSRGISHRDIKDENLVIDDQFKIKLIDFGSAVAYDVRKEAPWQQQFFGTLSFASSEILRNVPYQAPPAEIWCLGVLLAYLVLGRSPFADTTGAARGIISWPSLDEQISGSAISTGVTDLMEGCLRTNTQDRFTISDVRNHPWLKDDLIPT